MASMLCSEGASSPATNARSTPEDGERDGGAVPEKKDLQVPLKARRIQELWTVGRQTRTDASQLVRTRSKRDGKKLLLYPRSPEMEGFPRIRQRARCVKLKVTSAVTV